MFEAAITNPAPANPVSSPTATLGDLVAPVDFDGVATELAICPSSFSESRRFVVEQEPSSSFRRRATNPNMPRTFTLSYSHLTSAEKATIEKLWEQTGGGAGVIQFRPPGGGVSIDVRFASPPTFRKDRPGRYQAEFQLAALRPQD